MKYYFSIYSKELIKLGFETGRSDLSSLDLVDFHLSSKHRTLRRNSFKFSPTKVHPTSSSFYELNETIWDHRCSVDSFAWTWDSCFNIHEIQSVKICEQLMARNGQRAKIRRTCGLWGLKTEHRTEMDVDPITFLEHFNQINASN
jgi:hypothetical protein